VINLLHGPFLHQEITTVVRKDLATREEAEWAEREIGEHEERIAKQEEQMATEREGDREIPRLMEVPGIGQEVSLAFVAFIGDGRRFESASQVSNYLGLAPRVGISGTIVKYGGITKRGNM
jgi:transposase